MFADMRPTFEHAYRNVIANSAVHELKCCFPDAGQATSLRAAEQDEKNFDHLFKLLCEDLTTITGRKYELANQFQISYIAHFFHPVIRWPEVIMNEYGDRLPGFVNGTLDKIVPRKNTIKARPKIGWVVWSNNNVYVSYNTDQTEETFQDAEIRSLADFPHSPYVREVLARLQKTHFNYSPYILVGRNKRKTLAIQLGQAWKDISLGWDRPVKQTPVTDCRIVGIPLAMLVLCISLAYLMDGVVYWIGLGVMGLLCGLFVALTSMCLYDRYYKPIKV